MKRDELISYLDTYLNIKEIEDYGPQGLQVDSGRDTASKLALAVDAVPAVIEAAAEWKASMLLVHHGILWRTVEPIAGPLGKRVRLLLENKIDLYAAHLPLDAHPEVGNNAVLAKMLGLNIEAWWCAPKGTNLGVYGQLPEARPLDELAAEVDQKLGTKARVLAYGPERVRSVAILSGYGADEVKAAKVVGADTYLTGETSHSYYWAAADYGVNVIYAGHYATETVGVKALGAHLEERFGLETRFFDFPTEM